MKRVVSGSFAILVAAGVSAFSQQVTTPTAPAVAATAAAPVAASNGPDAQGMYTLREGEDVPLTFTDGLSSKTATEGDPVTLTLAEDLKVNGVVVARAGMKANGEVTNAKKAGMMVRPAN